MFVAKLNSITSFIPENRNTTSLFLFPNPTTGIINIESVGAENISVKLFSEIGNCVFQKEMNVALEIDPSGLSKGIYFYELIQGKNVSKNKIVVY